MPRHRLVAFSFLVGALFLSILPSLGGAQSNADYFQQIVDGTLRGTLLSGPNALALEQQEGVLSAYKAGLDVADFVAHAVFTNPDVDDGVGWDYGFQFRTTGNNEDYRLFILSDGTWNFTIGTAAPEQSAVTPNFDPGLGASNTLDLIVDGNKAYFGINGEFVGMLSLPDLQRRGDVYASTGFLGEYVVPGRVIGLSDFTVSTLPGAEQPQTAVAGAIPPPRPVALRAGSCANPGEVVEPLREATYPEGEQQGQASAVVAATSFTRVPRFLADLLAEPNAIVVGRSFDAPNAVIACGDIGGIEDEIGGYVIALTEQNDSGVDGIAYLAGEDDLGRTNVSVFLAPRSPAPPVVAATPPATAATPEAVIDLGATPASVIQVEDDARGAAPVGTPVT